MAHKTINTFKKKEREEAKRRKKIAKDARRVERKERKDGQEPRIGIEDPDLEGIVPGPQPRSDD